MKRLPPTEKPACRPARRERVATTDRRGSASGAGRAEVAPKRPRHDCRAVRRGRVQRSRARREQEERRSGGDGCGRRARQQRSRGRVPSVAATDATAAVVTTFPFPLSTRPVSFVGDAGTKAGPRRTSPRGHDDDRPRRPLFQEHIEFGLEPRQHRTESPAIAVSGPTRLPLGGFTFS